MGGATEAYAAADRVRLEVEERRARVRGWRRDCIVPQAQRELVQECPRAARVRARVRKRNEGEVIRARPLLVPTLKLSSEAIGPKRAALISLTDRFTCEF